MKLAGRQWVLGVLIALTIGQPVHAQFEHSEVPVAEYVPQEPSAVFGGADFLFMRPHFSQAIAFAQGQQAADSYSIVGRELPFDYEAGVRVFGGYRLGGGRGEIRFSYLHFQGDAVRNGDDPGAGNFLVDPFGNIVGTAVVVDPRDGRFQPPLPPGPTVLMGGDRIRTRAVTETNVYDVAWVAPFWQSCCTTLQWSAGLRIADVDQSYRSIVTLADAPLATGDFTADFLGVGPRLGLESLWHFGDGRFSIFANAHGSLLVGQYDVRFTNTTTLPVEFRASQSERALRTVPVAEIEAGAAWQVTDCWRLSAGWLVHAWFDLGASGGTFGGFFQGADDANLMSFDGLFLRSELQF